MRSPHARFVATVIATAVTVACGGSSSPTEPTATTSSTRTVTSLSVSVSALTLNVGGTVALTATASYSDGTSANVSATWESSNSPVASVSEAGTVTAHAVGTATITAMFGGQSGSVSVEVGETLSLSSLEVSAADASLRMGETTTVKAEAEYSDGSEQLVTPTWSSSDPGVASVTAEGVVAALAVGTTVITGTYEDQSGSVNIDVSEAVSLSSIEVFAEDSSLRVGETTTVKAEAEYSDGSEQLVTPTWSSSDPGVASVTAEGVVAALAVGTTVITGTYEDQSGSVNIDVSEAVSLSSIEVFAEDSSLTVGQTTTVTATASYTDGTSAVISANWASSDTSVATVTTSGTVTALAVGTTTITATAEGQSGSIAVTVAAATSTWRGIVIADENRCSPYDSGDYSYPQSVEDDIIARLGGIYSPYTGECFASKSETDIEHMLARSEAHDSGLCAVDEGTRSSFGRDLDNLTLASPSLNRYEKGAKDAADWLPDRNRCWFVDTIIEVRRKYGLTIDQREADAIDQVLASCPSTDLEPTTCDLLRPSAILELQPPH